MTGMPSTAVSSASASSSASAADVSPTPTRNTRTGVPSHPEDHSNMHPNPSATSSNISSSMSPFPSTSASASASASPSTSTSATPSSSAKPPSLPHSSDSFLRHLHNDPEAAHLSLSATHSSVSTSGLQLVEGSQSSNGIGPHIAVGLMGKPLDVFPQTAKPAGRRDSSSSQPPRSATGPLRSSRLRTPSGGARVTTRPMTAPPSGSSQKGMLTSQSGQFAHRSSRLNPDAADNEPTSRNHAGREGADGLTRSNGNGSGSQPENQTEKGNENEDEDESIPIWPALPSPTEIDAVPRPEIPLNVDYVGPYSPKSGTLPSLLTIDAQHNNQLVDTPTGIPPTPTSAEEEGDCCIDAMSARLSEMVSASTGQSGSVTSNDGSSESRKQGSTRLVGLAGTLGPDSPTDSPEPPISGTIAVDGQSYAHAPFNSVTSKLSPESDWAHFIRAYSEGRWDPNRIPNPPQSVQPSFAHTNNAALISGSQPNSSGSSSSPAAKTVDSAGTNVSTDTTLTVPSNMSLAFNPHSPPTGPSKRHSMHDLPGAAEAQSEQKKRQHPGQIAFNSQAAAIRLASSGLTSADFSPLNVPSPERELMDPLANATLYQSSKGRSPSSSSESAVSLGYKQSGSWPGTQSLDPKDGLHLPSHRLDTIPASPLGTPAVETPNPVLEKATTVPEQKSGARRMSGILPQRPKIPPASAPVEWHTDKSSSSSSDYFGEARYKPTVSSNPSPATRTNSSRTVTASSSKAEEIPSTLERRHSASKPKLVAHSSHKVVGTVADATEPSPRSVFSHHEAPAATETGRGTPAPNYVNAHVAQENFRQLGYLRAPMPSSEADRRRALYKFNIMHTPNDVNFDRIAHLAKLVFSAKIVMIALVDEKDQWHKVEFGMGSEAAGREDSLCAHAILARNDEPLVVLDAQLDWRFANNPNVVGHPHLRFYAGAPLRTSDGHNIGSLCVIDTQPRTEFSPRSRMALKEFAAITVREMELWRDKTTLKARDRIQTSMEHFTRECLELDNAADLSPANAAAKMDQVYDRAAKLVRKTLDVDGALVLDLSQFESIEVSTEDDTVETIYQADPYDVGVISEDEERVTYLQDNSWVERKIAFSPLPPWAIMGSSEKLDPPKDRSRQGTSSEHAKFSEFLKNNPEGKIYEDVVPTWIRHALPPGIQYLMIVPIFNIDKHPFALLCAYISNTTRRYLEGYELQFLRAIGVVILSAVLKRRMVLADKAKSNFISNISHELRTPLHGILAAAELLSDTPLDSNQQAFIQTVQACGNSLIETVNHVLDFTKLSGSAKNNSENVIKLGQVDLAKLVEETVEGCWIGQRARTFQGQSEIGSFYSPPSANATAEENRRSNSQHQPVLSVETVIDIGLRDHGWLVKCEKGGIRRVLMNLIGNSLKFTSEGYIQVTLRELPHTPGARSIPIEMAVIDTGKGISKQFLKEQLFHPFSQENPLQTGTGLGLAIVNSIVRSESVNGKVDVWSSEGLGTEIKVTLNVEVADVDESSESSRSSSFQEPLFGVGRTACLVEFDTGHRGTKLNAELISSYALRWGFNLVDDENEAEILIVNENAEKFLSSQQTLRRLLVVSSIRASRPSVASLAFTKAGGFVQYVFKPVGPSRLENGLRACVRDIEHTTPSQDASRSVRSDYFSPSDSALSPTRSVDERVTFSRETSQKTIVGVNVDTTPQAATLAPSALTSRHLVQMQSEGPGMLMRRRSEEDRPLRKMMQRPGMAPRSITSYDIADSFGSRGNPPSGTILDTEEDLQSIPGSPSSSVSTISLADGGVMLKVAAAPVPAPPERKARVLIVDDNNINLNLLGAYLRKRGMNFLCAQNGQICLDIFTDETQGPWDIILMDISMPVLDGFGATRAVRRIEAERRRGSIKPNDCSALTTISTAQVPRPRTMIFALSGRATADDKKQAFAAGVDGYLVKPVKLSALDILFRKLGFA